MARETARRPRQCQRPLALLLALASFSLASAWAAYLAYWMFSDSDLGDYEQAVVVVVATVPPIVSACGLMAAAFAGDRERNIVWASAGVLGLFIAAPALMGFGYAPAIVLMVCAALATPLSRKPSITPA